jgi:hypothetical protein
MNIVPCIPTFLPSEGGVENVVFFLSKHLLDSVVSEYDLSGRVVFTGVVTDEGI